MGQPELEALKFRPRWIADPIWMEYILEQEIEAELRNRLLATHLQTIAELHTVYANEARTMAEVLVDASAR